MEVRRILVDTNAYVAFKRGDPEAIAVIQRASIIAINAVVLGELLGGFAVGTREEANRGDLACFLDSPRVVVLPLDRHTAEHYAAVYSALKKAGTPIPTNDMWIAASAIQHELAVFSFDRHLVDVPRLKVVACVSELEAV